MQIAIIDNNVLAAVGLKRILEDIIPMAEINIISPAAMLQGLPKDVGDRPAHCFVSSSIYFEHAQYFLKQPYRCIVMVQGESTPQMAGLLTLNVCQDERSLIMSILSLHGRGHGGTHAEGKPHIVPPVLSPRETEVAVLLAKGCINKEVADRLNISLTTVISHRKNIMEKLHARSLATIIIYVVTHGLVALEDL